MNRRKARKLYDIVRNTRIDRNLYVFIRNFLRYLSSGYKNDTTLPAPYPPTMSLELTNRCNLHCIMCPREYDYGKELVHGEMPTELAKQIIDEIIPYQQSMGLTGMGETLFASNLPEVAQYIKSKKKSVVIFISTNANFPDFIQRLTPVLPYIDTIQISTDGVGAGYEKVRKGGDFALLDKNLTELVPLANAHRVDVMFNMVVSKVNFRQMPDLIEYASAKGVRFVNFNYINLASLTGITETYYEFFQTEEFQSVLEATRRQAKCTKDVEVTGLDFPGNPGIRKCPLMWNHLQINVDGEMPPCCAKPFPRQYSFGNVKDGGVLKVLNSDNTRRFRSSYSTGTPHAFCKNCVFVKL